MNSVGGSDASWIPMLGVRWHGAVITPRVETKSMAAGAFVQSRSLARLAV
jgi:hypothetical protein